MLSALSVNLNRVPPRRVVFGGARRRKATLPIRLNFKATKLTELATFLVQAIGLMPMRTIVGAVSKWDD